jgi:hypothetical protein
MKFSNTHLICLIIVLISLYFFFTNVKEGLEVQKDLDKKKMDALIVSAITDRLNMYVPVASAVLNNFIESEKRRKM